MNETFSSIEFNKNTTSPSEVLETVAREGAAAVHDFFVPNHLRRSARTLEVADWWTDVEDADDTVHRRHDLTRYGFSSDYPWPVSSAGAGFPPEPIFTAARRISEFVNEGTDISWRPNEIIGHRYEAGDFIAKHRDYARALGFVAVLTLEGSQRHGMTRRRTRSFMSTCRSVRPLSAPAIAYVKYTSIWCWGMRRGTFMETVLVNGTRPASLGDSVTSSIITLFSRLERFSVIVIAYFTNISICAIIDSLHPNGYRLYAPPFKNRDTKQ